MRRRSDFVAALILGVAWLAGCSLTGDADPFEDPALTVYAFETDDSRGAVTSSGRIGLRPDGEGYAGIWEIEAAPGVERTVALAGEGTLDGVADGSFVVLRLRPDSEASGRSIELRLESALIDPAWLDRRLGQWTVFRGDDPQDQGFFALTLRQTGTLSLVD